MAKNNFLDTQIGGESQDFNYIASEESQDMDLSPKEVKAKKEVEKETEKELEKTEENLTVNEVPKKVQGNEASEYIPVSETSVDPNIPTSAESSTAKQLLQGGEQKLEDKQKIFNNLGGFDKIYEESKQNEIPEVVDNKMDDLMAQNNVNIKNLNVDFSKIFDKNAIRSLKTNSIKAEDEFGRLIDVKPPVEDIDEESSEDEVTEFGYDINTPLDFDIYENRIENKNNYLLSEGMDGVYRYDLGEDKNQDGVQTGGPSEEDEPGPNGYYIMKGRAYYKNRKGDWYKLYPKDKKSIKEEGVNSYNSYWIKLENPKRVRAVERKAQFYTYRDIKEKNLLQVSNDMIRRMQEAYSDPMTDLNEFQVLEEVAVLGHTTPWGYEDQVGREEALKKIGRGRESFQKNGDYKFAGKDYVKQNGKWFYKNDKGALEAIYDADKQIFKLERSALPKSLVGGKNSGFVSFVQKLGSGDIADIQEIYIDAVRSFDDWYSDGPKQKVVSFFDEIKNRINRKAPSTLNNQARAIAMSISEKWTSGTLTEAEYELIRSFGVLRDEYLNYGDNKAIFEETYGNLGDIWRSPDKKKDLMGNMYKGELKAGMEMIGYLANGGTMTPKIKGNGLYNVGGEYLIKREGRWTELDGTPVTDKEKIEIFNSTGFPGVYDLEDFGVGIDFMQGRFNYSPGDLAKPIKDLTIQEEIFAMTVLGDYEMISQTDLYNIYNSNDIIKVLVDDNLKEIPFASAEISGYLKNPPKKGDLAKKEQEEQLQLYNKRQKRIEEINTFLDDNKVSFDVKRRLTEEKRYLEGDINLYSEIKTAEDVIGYEKNFNQFLEAEDVLGEETRSKSLQISDAIISAISDFNKYETDKQRIKWFSENSFQNSSMTKNQRGVVEKAQEDAKMLLDELSSGSVLGMSGWNQITTPKFTKSDLHKKMHYSTQKNKISEFISRIDQLVQVVEQNNDLNNQIKSSGKSKDLIFLGRKEDYLRNFSAYMPAGLTENMESAVKLFDEKKKLARYVLDLESKGLVEISSDGEMKYTEKASQMGEKYMSKVEQEISVINGMIDLYSTRAYDTNIELRAELEASIENSEILVKQLVQKLALSESEKDFDSIMSQINRLNQTVEVNQARLNNIKLENYTVLLTGAEEFAEDVMGSVTEGFLNPYLVALEGLQDYSAKNKFDLMVENLTDRMIELVQSGDINTEFGGEASRNIRDLLSWDGWLELSEEEKEYYQIVKTLKSCMPLYLNNEYQFEAKDRGFFNSFLGTFYKTAFPNAGGAKNLFGVDMLTEKEQAGNISSLFESAEITEKDLTGPEKLQEVIDQAKRESDLFSREFAGELVGGSTFYIGTIPMAGWATGGLFKMAVATQKLTVGAKGLTIAEKAYNAIPKIYMNTLGTTRLGRFLGPAFYTAYQFERAGRVFGAAEEEMTALGGFMGGAGVSAFKFMGKKVSGTIINEFAKSLFSKSPNSLITWEKFTRGVQIGGGHGSGELVEETMQVFAKAFNQMPEMEKLYEVLGQSFGTFDRFMKHIVGSFAMGALFGFGSTKATRSMYEGLNSEQKSKVDKAVKEITEELDASMDATAEYLSQQNKKIHHLEENSKIDDSKDTEGVSSEEQVGQESVQEQSIEETSEETTGPDRVVPTEQTQETKTEETQETKEEQSKIKNEEQSKQEEQNKKQSEVEYESLEEREKSRLEQQALKELELENAGKEKGKKRITQDLINKKAQEIYARDGLRINIGKNANEAKGQRVTVTVNTESEFAGVDMTITDEFGNSIGNVRGNYDVEGNFDIEEVNITEGKRGQQYGTEVISVINENTNNNVIISGNTESTEALGKSLENNLEATQDGDGNYIVNNTQENILKNEEATNQNKEELSTADKVREMKVGNEFETILDENGNPIPAPKRNSLKFFDAAWNASVEAAAQVIEKGGSLYKTIASAQAKFKKTAFYQSFKTEAEQEAELAKFVLALEEKLGTEEFSKAQKALESLKKKAMKNFINSEYYQSLPARSKARREAKQEFEDKLAADTERIISEKMKKNEVLDVDKMVGEYAAETRKNEGPLDLKMSIAEKIKANKNSDLGVIKQEMIKYIEKALPKSKYTKKQLTSLINDVNNANTIAAAQRVFNKVDNKSKKDYENRRKETYRDTYNKIHGKKKGSINEQMKYKSGEQRMSNESIRAYNDFIKQNDLSQGALENMSLEELVLINDALSEIVETGKFDQKIINEQRENVRREKQASILEGFERLEGKKKVMTVDDVLNPDAIFKGSFVIDGKYFSPSEAKAYVKRMNKEGNPPASINFYRSVDLDYDVESGYKGGARNYMGLSISDFSYKLKRLYAGKFGILTKGYKGNQELKNLADKIDKGVKWAYALEQQDNLKFEDELKAHLNKTFGKSVSERVGQMTGISSMLSSELKAVPKNTDQFFAEGRFEGKKRKITNDKLIDLYLYGKDPRNNSEARRSLEADGYNMDAVDAYVESNKNLLDHATWIENQYNEIAKKKYGVVLSKYKGNFDIEFKDEYYYPRNVKKEGRQTEEEIAQQAIQEAGGLQGLLIHEKTPANSHVEARTELGNNSLVNRGATEKLIDYTRGMNHVEHFYETAVDISMITNNKAISDAIVLNGGKRALNDFKRHAELILGGEQAGKGWVKGSNKSVDYLSTIAVIKTLGMSTKNIPKQLSSSFHWIFASTKYGLGPIKSGINQVANVFVKQKGETDEQYATRIEVARMVMNSPFVRYRWKGVSIDESLNSVIAEGQGDGALKRMISKGSKFALLYTRIGDMGGVVMGGIPFTYNLYMHYRKSEADGGRGMTHEEALQAAYVSFTAEANDIQQSSRGDHKSLSQRSPLVKALTMYTTSQQAIIKKTMNAYKLLTSRTKLSREEKTQAFYDLVYYPTFGNLIFNATASGYIAGALWDDEDEMDPDVKERETFDILTDSLIGSNLQGLGPGGFIPGVIFNTMKDRDVFNNLPFHENLIDIATQGKEGVNFLSGVDSYVNIAGVDVSVDTKWKEISKKENEKVIKELVRENESLISKEAYNNILNLNWDSWTPDDMQAAESLWSERVEIAKEADVLDRIQQLAFPDRSTFAEVWDAMTDADIETIMKEVSKGVLEFGLGEEAVELLAKGDIDNFVNVFSGWPQSDETTRTDRVAQKPTPLDEISDRRGKPRPGGTKRGDNIIWDAYQMGKKLLGSEADYKPYVLEKFLQQGFYDASPKNRKIFMKYLQQAENLTESEVDDMYNENEDKMNELWDKHINYGIRYQEPKKKGKDDKIESIGRGPDKEVERDVIEREVDKDRD